MNHYPLAIFWSAADGGFIAEVPDLPSCSAWGNTESEAALEAQQAIIAWIEAAHMAERDVPPASTIAPIDHYSGKFLVRVPRTLHARLARRARVEGVSLNQYVAHLLSL